jgi:hypothetical protein
MINAKLKALKLIVIAVTSVGVSGLVYLQPTQNQLSDIPNRLPEAAPYVVAEAREFPPPYHGHWVQEDSPGQCQTCHQKIFDEWNGSMMSNSWRDPVWRAAFLLLARSVSTNGECDTPQPPDNTPKATHNPFAKKGECASVFDIGGEQYKVSRPGSLLDFFCSRCHMPTDYIDNIPLKNVKIDPRTKLETAAGDPHFNPTSDNGTGLAYATLDAQFRNTESGKSGIICAVCHTYAETRDTPFHNYARSAGQYTPVPGKQARSELLASAQQEAFQVPDTNKQNLGYSIGAGSYRLSPHAIVFPERFGPLASGQPPKDKDSYVSQTFGRDIPYQHMDISKHQGYRQEMFIHSEMCAACHDVTNPLPIKNTQGKWVGGFPIERTYTEWANSAYADRPGNSNFDPRFKRDCQSCHMQQDYGQPGTAQTLYDEDGKPLPPLVDLVSNEGGSAHPFFTHHFVGGNAYVTRMIGKDIDQSGNVAPYPELSAFSFSSADHGSVYSRALWMNIDKRGGYAQQARLAWDRLRHVLRMEIAGSLTAEAGAAVPISVTIANTGSGHNFPTGFPEGRTSWLAIHAYDLATGKELQIRDNVWKRTSLGVGNLTTEEVLDPNFPGCNWKIPAGSADPYSIQFKAIATLGNGCPTLDLPYATPLNLQTNGNGLPVDKDGRVIDASNPGLEVFIDKNGNGDYFDDSFLMDTRFKPRGRPGNQVKVDRYSVVIPPGTQGPVAVTSTVYYQSVEAIVAMKFLGNMADTNNNFILEPCVLGGLCNGQKPATEPPVVEGAPPVPMIVRDLVISIGGGAKERAAPRIATYPAPGANEVYQDAVVKVFFSEPVQHVDSFTLSDFQGTQVPASIDQIGDGTWGLFPHKVLLTGGETYTARLKAGVCDLFGKCTRRDLVWRFTVSKEFGHGAGDTTIPMGFVLLGQTPQAQSVPRR